MSHLARALVLAVALVILSATPARAGTIVFDFEDGLQGWELHGAVQRVQTQLLGGEWAIFGDGFIQGSPSLTRELDLTGFGSLRLDHHFLEGDLESVLLSITRLHPGSRLVEALLLFPVGAPGPLNLEEGVTFGPAEGVWTVEFRWQRSELRVEEGEISVISRSVVAFIDNITLHTIPEPSLLGMLVMGGVLLAVRRRSR